MTKPAEFFNSLMVSDQITILEMALQALRDELMDNFMREVDDNWVARMDLSDEELSRIHDEISNYMESGND